MAQKRIHLDLRLDPDREPVAGELVPPGGPPMRFSGYAGLVAALGRIWEPGATEVEPSAPVEGDPKQ